MDDKTLIAKRVAMELRPGYLGNLGIGLPTLVAGGCLVRSVAWT